MYPSWKYYPSNSRAPEWASRLVKIFEGARERISTEEGSALGLKSDDVLRELSGALIGDGYAVERGKAQRDRITRPVLYGENGVPSVSYEIDAFHDELGVVLEVEAGRGARGNANYRDIVRTSLILDARYLAMALPLHYRHLSSGRAQAVESYADTRKQLDAIYASERLQLPFDGVLLVGY